MSEAGALARPAPGAAHRSAPPAARPQPPPVGGPAPLALAALVAVVAFAAPRTAHAQIETPRPLDLPDFAPPSREPGHVLPPVPLPGTPDTEGLDAGVRVLIRGVRVTGNTVLPDAELAVYTDPYRDRVVSWADLAALRDAITRAYVEAGYVSSGARIPDQQVADGIVVLEVVESALGDIEVSTDGNWRPDVIRARLRHDVRSPVNVYQLEEQLEILREDPRIARLEGRLLPGDEPGESRLVVTLHERQPFVMAAEFDNYHSPAIGSEGGHFEAAFPNVTGFGDRLGATYDLTDGLDDVEARYGLPLGPWGTELELRMRKTWSEVVDDRFNDLGIRSETTTWAATLRQRLYRSLRNDVSVFVTGERRRSRATFDGPTGELPFPSDGAQDGRTKMTLLRFGGDWVFRGTDNVMAFRSTLTWGTPWLDATKNPGDVPDGRFVAWLGQAQYAHRLPFLESRLLARFDLQLSDEPLLALEQFAVGGHDSVRGYRENQLVRDQGYAGSIGVRSLVWRGGRGFPSVEVEPFVDFGRSWNRDRVTEGPRSMLSAGIGLRLALTRFLSAELDWAQTIRHIDRQGEHDLQDSGISFRIRVDLP